MPLYNINSGPRGFVQPDAVPWMTQPSSVALVDSRISMAAGLGLAILGGVSRESVNGSLLTPTAANVYPAISGGGGSWYFSATAATDKLALPVNSLLASGSGSCSWAASFLLTDLTNTYALIETSGSGLSGLGLRVEPGGTIWVYNSGGGAAFLTNKQVVANKRATVALAIKPSTGSYSVWFDGSFDSSGTSGTTFTPVVGGDILGHYGSSGSAFKGHVFGFWSWPARYLSDPELREVSRNPWQLFAEP